MKRIRDNRAAYLRYHYKLSMDDYIEMKKDGCMVCGNKEKLTIDHDHTCCPPRKNPSGSRLPTCGKCVRGVLCHGHNLAEGHLHGDPEEMLLLMKYTLKHSKTDVSQSFINDLEALAKELSNRSPRTIGLVGE